MRFRELIFALGITVMAPTAQAGTIVIHVKGMVCGFCAQGIEKKLKTLAPVSSVKVDLETKTVELKIKDDLDVSDAQINKLVTEAGYDVERTEREK